MSQKAYNNPIPNAPTIPPLDTTSETTKLCHIVKRPDFQGYGFNLHSEKVKPGQYIGKVDASSPAESAGLKEGDRIIEVNGVAIGSETHKQVVQRIKAIACDVRLLLIDVDNNNGNGSSRPLNESSIETSCSAALMSHAEAAQVSANGNTEVRGTIQEMPGASANISSISMICTKRTSAEQHSNGHRETALSAGRRNLLEQAATSVVNKNNVINNKTNNEHNLLSAGTAIGQLPSDKNNSNKNMTTILPMPPPPSAAVATVPQTAVQPLSAPTPHSSENSSTANKTGSLQLPMTAAEMRAKLMSKKKFDPKNESVDLKKKFDIIQKL